MRRNLGIHALSSAIAAAAALLFATEIHAFSCRPSLIPNGTKFSCSTCHTRPEGGGERNDFGKAVDRIALGCDLFWGPGIAALDSDGDGRTNGAELGDPEGKWQRGQPPPGNLARVTNPGDFDEPPAAFIRGDSNLDGDVDIADAVKTLGFLFLGDPPIGCLAAADANRDDSVDISDASYTLAFLFLGEAIPPAPFPSCGPDFQTALDCASHPPCE